MMNSGRRAVFGVAGNPPNFWGSEFSSDRADAPQWLRSIGLGALEIQCTYGVRMPDERIEAFRVNAERYDIALSIHAPYYISISSPDPEGVERSLRELDKAVQLARQVGSTRVVFHPGSIYGDRVSALGRATMTLCRFQDEFASEDVCLFPEIAGKVGQLGTLDEILAMCEAVQCALPCLDLAHLHARTFGSLRTRDDFVTVLDRVVQRLGHRALHHMHVHLYPVAWGNGGEVGHKAFSDTKQTPQQVALFPPLDETEDFYRPRYEEFLEVVVERRLSPIIICEAKDSQDVGALEMKRHYLKLLRVAGVGQGSKAGQEAKGAP